MELLWTGARTRRKEDPWARPGPRAAARAGPGPGPKAPRPLALAWPMGLPCDVSLLQCRATPCHARPSQLNETIGQHGGVFGVSKMELDCLFQARFGHKPTFGTAVFEVRGNPWDRFSGYSFFENGIGLFFKATGFGVITFSKMGLDYFQKRAICFWDM